MLPSRFRSHIIESDLGQSHSKTLLRCYKNDLLRLSLLNYLFQLAHDMQFVRIDIPGREMQRNYRRGLEPFICDEGMVRSLA